ncbi:hypothetical protein CI610_03270 [invertebrate metagenome]|uniref:RING-type domain-containing protein n=1 Tax=invertebrate metagenome TaxID=1711999 RepID=A0A2H9T3K5_9ZZZZ
MRSRIIDCFLLLHILFMPGIVTAASMSKEDALVIVQHVVEEDGAVFENTPSDMVCAVLSVAIKSDNLEPVALKLGLSHIEIDSIKYKKDSLTQKREVFFYWRSKNTKSSIKELFFKHIFKCSETDFLWEELCQRLNDLITLSADVEYNKYTPWMLEKINSNEDVKALLQRREKITERMSLYMSDISGNILWPYCFGKIRKVKWEQIELDYSCSPRSVANMQLLLALRVIVPGLSLSQVVRIALVAEHYSVYNIDWSNIREKLDRAFLERPNQTHVIEPTYSVAQGVSPVTRIETDENRVFDSLPKCRETGSGEPECSVCNDHKININLFCGHGFCSHCIQQWVEYHGKVHTAGCPTCRKEIDATQISPRYD